MSPTTPDFGNETACANCGDEWTRLDEMGLCPDCREVWEEGNQS
jgi:predicted amidophosphoribosyltransferase